MLVTATLKLDGVTLHTFKQSIHGAGYQPIRFDVPLDDVSVDTHSLQLYMETDTGTFTLDADEQSLYITGLGFISA